MNPLALLPLQRTALNLQSLALAAVPHGGQRSARRNAWAAMSADAVRARSRHEAEEVMAGAVQRAAARAQHPSARAR